MTTASSQTRRIRQLHPGNQGGHEQRGEGLGSVKKKCWAGGTLARRGVADGIPSDRDEVRRGLFLHPASLRLFHTSEWNRVPG